MTRPLIVAGIDLSLTSTGVALITTQPDPDRHTRRIESKGQAKATLAERNTRLTRLARAVTDEAGGADLIVIEQPAYSRQVGSMHDRSGLWWLVVNILVEDYTGTVVEVSPTTRARYATGKGNAAKDLVLASVIKRYPDWDVTGNDVADALVLAAMGARHLGYPIEMSLPATHLAAMAGVAWPPHPVRMRLRDHPASHSGHGSPNPEGPEL
jgi:crossover junction endodeoxyribonuclease RuvC